MIHTATIESLRKSRDAVLNYFDVAEVDLAKSYAPGKWTARQILLHLADVEFVYLWRLCRASAEPGSDVEGFDQDKWVAALQYDTRSLGVGECLFSAARDRVIELLASTDEAGLVREVVHSEAGSMTLAKVAHVLDFHTWHHIEQIEAAIKGEVWTPKK
ncbi:MAG: DinB family protein [Candidatus Hydrogenedentes bacterium]|nr:DinB family protein [Candidatus Hydrogenedentota bacterium]